MMIFRVIIIILGIVLGVTIGEQIGMPTLGLWAGFVIGLYLSTKQTKKE